MDVAVMMGKKILRITGNCLVKLVRVILNLKKQMMVTKKGEICKVSNISQINTFLQPILCDILYIHRRYIILDLCLRWIRHIYTFILDSYLHQTPLNILTPHIQ